MEGQVDGTTGTIVGAVIATKTTSDQPVRTDTALLEASPTPVLSRKRRASPGETLDRVVCKDVVNLRRRNEVSG
ncbi:hypothetical protein FOXG_22710 [Fusarium oxysporum f. sp. lycopersici 4287]|uniref:Uncharacterized protein n=1 Tax=Fusarium oxysporum f. sp. lycopersici (strain 4287 / CBS 123668 / FGSC 9935 / NRRL 34936) TaxID=426428 RepID=A0A0J9WVR6_FUSO4|nr:hypothetical protein FOXG_22710 [Fusarium oxysporum f. sp. lycopersici 4287]EWZ78893.1 hypothetical protein FOWG_16898 [Fusarium oxysporum f. sp. lycopersici MN25]KNB19997.1 hypothetical protein FOXG_22710 [Fusarium oxysporum f. sp. lycopersici 4287]